MSLVGNDSVDIESQMLNALELLHYAYRFRHNTFALAFLPGTLVEDLELDLRLLQTSRIKYFLMCCKESSPRAWIKEYNSRWTSFSSLKSKGRDLVDTVAKSFADGKVPLISLEEKKDPVSAIESGEIFEIAGKLQVDKLFIFANFDGLVVDGKFRSHLTLEDLETLLLEKHEVNIPKEFLYSIIRQAKAISSEIVILCAKAGCLFDEIFTHHGKGTLLTSAYPNEIKTAELSDAHEIALLMRPYIRSESVLPLSEDQIAAEIRNYSLYTVNQQIVAIAKLTNYGEAAEIGKIVTLPRYQGQGRARDLVNLLISNARKQGRKYVFSLSINPAMWTMFTQLGFNEVERESLPEAWKASYDFSRPSRAFVKNLVTEIPKT